MNKRSLVHALTITTIVIAAFVAAALTPAKTYASTDSSKVVNIAKVDHEARTDITAKTVIPDNEIPLAAVPSDPGFNMTMWLIAVSSAALMSGIVIYEELKYRKNGRY